MVDEQINLDDLEGVIDEIIDARQLANIAYKKAVVVARTHRHMTTFMESACVRLCDAVMHLDVVEHALSQKMTEGLDAIGDKHDS